MTKQSLTNYIKYFIGKMITNSKLLFRSLMKEGRNFPEYQLKNYIQRRVREDFRKNRSLAGEEAKAAISFGNEQLELIKRQSVVRSLYQAPKTFVELQH